MHLRLGAGMLQNIHLAVMADRLEGQRDGRDVLRLFLAGGQRQRQGEEESAVHGVTLRKAAAASASAANGQIRTEAADCQSGMASAAPADARRRRRRLGCGKVVKAEGIGRVGKQGKGESLGGEPAAVVGHDGGQEAQIIEHHQRPATDPMASPAAPEGAARQ